MPKITRTVPKQKQKQTEYYFLVFGKYERAAEAGESQYNQLCIDLNYHQSFVPREMVLFFLYQAAVPLDNKVLRGSMTITGIQTLTAEQRQIWQSDTGVLRNSGWDTATRAQGSVKIEQ